MTHEGETGMKGVVALGMLVNFASHGAYDRKFISHLTDFREHRTDGNSTLAILLEFEGTGEDVAVVVELGALHLHRHGLSGKFFEGRLGVEAVYLRNPTRHVAKDNAFGFFERGSSGEKAAFLLHQTLKGEKTETGGTTGQHAATSNKLVHGLLQVDEFLHVKESKGNVLGTSSGSVAGGLVLGKFAFQFGYAFLEVCLALALWG